MSIKRRIDRLEGRRRPDVDSARIVNRNGEHFAIVRTPGVGVTVLSAEQMRAIVAQDEAYQKTYGRWRREYEAKD